MNKLLEKADQYILYSVIFLTPLVFASISPNPYVPMKLAILVFAVMLLLVSTGIKAIIRGKFVWNVGSFDLPILLLVLAYLVSTYLRTPNKMEALLLPGTTTSIVTGALLYFMFNQVSEKAKKQASSVLLVSGVVVSLFTFIAVTKALENVTGIPAYMRLPQFNPVGGHLPGALFLVSLMPLTVVTFLSQKDVFMKALVAIAGFVVVFALFVSTYAMLPGNVSPLRLPSTSTTWPIAIDSLKESPLLGVGPSNYLTAFNRFRPLTFNGTDLWAVKYSTANSFYLTAMTETGMLGVAALALLLFALYKFTRNHFKTAKENRTKTAALVSALILAVLLFFFPATVVITTTLFVMLAFATSTKEMTFNLSAQGSDGAASKVPAVIASLPVLALVGFVGLRSTQILTAEYRFKVALDALARNEGLATYNGLRDAINTNPFVDRYHARYSQVNLALANSLAAQAQNGELTEQQRNEITQLIQQAIREARATVTLNPTRAGNWELLGRTYQAVIPLAEGADSYAAQSYTQAVLLDPNNPNLRIALGGIFYAAGDYANAVNIFGLAVRVKPDLANAHYNLAFALKEAGNNELAIDELTTVLSLVDRDSKDYELARTALEELQSQTPSQADAQPTDSENLSAPQDAADPILNPPLELTEEEAPPESALTPTPTPEDGDEEAEASPTPTLNP